MKVYFKEIAISSGRASDDPDWIYGLDRDGNVWIAEVNTKKMEWTKLESPEIILDGNPKGPF